MSELKILSRAEILAVDDKTTEIVPVPEWGGAVRIKALNGKERDAWEESIVIKGKKGSFEVNSRRLRTKLIAVSAVDENGALLFSEDDVDALAGKSAAALERVFKAAQRLSGLSEEDIKEAEEVLKAAPNGGSATA